jgi:anthranilate phosphoribosyltransferase
MVGTIDEVSSALPTLESVGGWPAVLGALVARQPLTADQTAAALSEILRGDATSAQIAAFAIGLRIKGETVDEITGLVDAMLAFAEPVPVDDDLRARLVDTCGTGGDRSHSVNISTMAAFVVAGAGVPVCKHGNRAASSSSGSADVLEALGVAINLGPDGVARCITEAGMGFCFAARFHRALRHAGPTRSELGVPTVFNFLGPLANPARVKRQALGVSDPAMAEKLIGVLSGRGATRALVLYGHDGLDELSTIGPSTVLELRDGEVRELVVDPAELGLLPTTREALRGGDAATNAGLVRAVLEGERGPHRDIVVLNAAAALVAGDAADGLADGIALAQTVIDSGRAAAVLDALVRVSKEAAESSED